MSRYLFEHLGVLGQRILQAPSLAVFLDFDGTMAPLADTPDAVELSQTMRQIIRALARLEGVELGIISGRELADVQAKIGLSDVVCAGNHGLEIYTPECSFVEPAAIALSDAAHNLSVKLEQKLHAKTGVWVENKGLSLSVHYRLVAESEWDEVRRIVQATLASSGSPFFATEGAAILEIRPRVHWNKGKALGWLRERLKLQDALAIYMGDDQSDEDGFAALPDGITIRVGAAAQSAARYHVNDQEEAQEFLGWLANLLTDKFLVESRPASTL